MMKFIYNLHIVPRIVNFWHITQIDRMSEIAPSKLSPRLNFETMLQIDQHKTNFRIKNLLCTRIVDFSKLWPEVKAFKASYKLRLTFFSHLINNLRRL